MVKSILHSFLLLCLIPFASLHAQQLDHVLGELLIQTEEAKDIERILAANGQLRGQKTGLQKIRPLKTIAPIYLLRFDHQVIHEQDILASLRRNPLVLNAQFNHLLSLRQTKPNDPSFSKQWFWINENGVKGAIDADLAWDNSTGGKTPDGKDIVVAIVDNGIDLQHDDFKGNLWSNDLEIANNSIDDDNNGYVDDVRGWNINLDNDDVQSDINGDGHGVTIAGMVGAVGNNNTGVTGVNWNAKIMMIKSDDGASQAIALESYGYIYTMRKLFNETNGQKGAFIVSANTSWGLNFGNASDAPIWCSFYDSLGQVGVVSCAATTNLTTNVDINGDLPTTCPSDYLIAVTRTGKDQEQAGGFGPINIDLGAPGIDIYSTEKNNSYGFSTGTSLSSPLVAGMVAFLYSLPDNVLSPLAEADPAAAASLSRRYILEGVKTVNGFEDLVATRGIANLWNSTQLVSEDAKACLAPFGPKLISRTDVQVSLSWSPGVNVEKTKLRWRSKGAGSWIDEGFVDPPFLIQNLSPCSDYEFQVAANCSTGDSPYSPTVDFATDGCCTPPLNIVFDDIGTNEVNISWEAIFAAQSYELDYRLEGSTDWTNLSINTNTYDLENLESCAEYEMRIRTICDGEISEYSPIISFSTIGCGNCEDLPYCEVEGDTESEFIEKVVVAGVENSSGDNNGYAQFFALPIVMDPAGTYDIELTPGYPGFAYSENFYVWIDYNQDGDFEDADEAVLVYENTNTKVDSFFTIPANALSGNTRMRITIYFFDDPEVCASPKEGETEDYCITITGNNQPCFSPDNLLADVLDDFSALLAWEQVSTADKYTVSWKESLGSTWEQSTTSNTSYLASGLKSCTNYDYRVSSECGGIIGNFSEVSNFKTKCKTATNDLAESIQLKVFPNPFDQELILSYTEIVPQDWSIQLLNVQGILVQSTHTGSSLSVLNTSSLAPGIYFLRIQNKTSQFIQKVVKMD